MSKLLLKQYRKKSNMSQRDVAAALNMSQANYWRFEKGISLPNSDQIIKLCDIFSCTPNDLFGIHGAHSVAVDPLFEEYKKLVNKIKE